mgnify:CR=1 FL=1
MVLEFLAVVLRREESHEIGRYIVGVWNLEDMANAIVINNGPLDCINPDIAGGAVEAFDADVGLLGRCHKVIEVVSDTGSSPTIYQDVIRVRVKDCAMG